MYIKRYTIRTLSTNHSKHIKPYEALSFNYPLTDSSTTWQALFKWGFRFSARNVAGNIRECVCYTLILLIRSICYNRRMYISKLFHSTDRTKLIYEENLLQSTFTRGSLDTYLSLFLLLAYVVENVFLYGPLLLRVILPVSSHSVQVILRRTRFMICCYSEQSSCMYFPLIRILTSCCWGSSHAMRFYAWRFFPVTSML